MASDMYCVYVHIFPDGKKYVGITNNTQRRFANGNGYKGNPEMWKAIQTVGWENIEHRILEDGLTRRDAAQKEREWIIHFNSKKNGYNKSAGGGGGRLTYFSRHVNKMLDLCRHYGYTLQIMADRTNAILSLSENEDVCTFINYIDLQMTKLPGFDAWIKEDEYMACAMWLGNIHHELRALCGEVEPALPRMEFFGDRRPMRNKEATT